MPTHTITYNSRDLRSAIMQQFADIMWNSVIVTSAPDFVDDYVQQLDADVTYAMDVVAPTRTRTKRAASRPSAAWLSDAAKDAKCYARRLERRYRSTKTEADYVRWRKSSRSAVTEMNRARAEYYRELVLSANSAPRSLWCVVKRLLHTQTPRYLHK